MVDSCFGLAFVGGRVKGKNNRWVWGSMIGQRKVVSERRAGFSSSYHVLGLTVTGGKTDFGSEAKGISTLSQLTRRHSAFVCPPASTI